MFSWRLAPNLRTQTIVSIHQWPDITREPPPTKPDWPGNAVITDIQLLPRYPFQYLILHFTKISDTTSDPRINIICCFLKLICLLHNNKTSNICADYAAETFNLIPPKNMAKIVKKLQTYSSVQSKANFAIKFPIQLLPVRNTTNNAHELLSHKPNLSKCNERESNINFQSMIYYTPPLISDA